MPKLSELKLSKVRKTINYKVGEEDKIITVYNAIGKKRDNILKIIETGSKLTDKDKVAEMLYKSILKELTDITIDVKKSTSLSKYPSLTLLELNKEIDDILFELQYEYLTQQIRVLNKAKIAVLAASTMDKTKELTEVTEKLQNDNL